MSTSRDSRRQVKAYLLGAASVLAAELVFLGIVLAPTPTDAIAGSARPAIAYGAAPHAAEPSTPSSEPSTSPTRKAEPERPKRTAPERTTEAAPPPEPRNEPVTSGQQPGTIRLPDGGTARLVREEVGRDAVLPVPESLDEATWWGAGLAAPSGASVFAGHVNWNGSTGPFAELWDVHVDERVTVNDATGKLWRYRVSQILTLHKNELPARAASLFSQSGSHRIVLVTCGGRWIGGSTGYAENRVVIAEPA